ncbi:DUF4383 domain-containing protein [Ktedonospora formicarum]|uniref:DUF4383 domain-containing protein n=1 Tax=Ktedonospora formicarum TaxID=2778364 RepID=A0A8J3HYU3_9CHLR|nr:DUF4383 domain-containing protein [Ktedonospora formicarum]GHO46727.1 hypothetical protein KSX_48900 [Ktedonospora formicarum]
MPWTVNRYFTLAIAVIFLIVGTWGIAVTSTMQVGSLLIFDVDIVHNFFFFFTGTVAMIVTVLGPDWSKRFNQIIGIIYLVVGLLGLAYPTLYFDGRLLGIMHANLADHILHLFIGLVAIVLSFSPEGLAVTTQSQDATG